MSKMAQRLIGDTPDEVMAQLPLYAKDAKLPIREVSFGGGFYIELCMSCWILTGEGNRR